MHRRHLRPLLLGCLAFALAAVSATARAQTAPAQPRRPPWRFGTEIAFTDISGNRQLQLFQSTFSAARQTPETFNFDFKLETRYGRSQGVEAARAAAARVRLDWTPRALISPFLGFDWEYDRVRRIDSRIAGGAGANLNIAYRDDSRTTLSIGVVEEYVNTAASATAPGTVTSDTRLHSRFALLRRLRPGLSAEFNVKYQPATRDMSDYLFKADGALRVALSTKLSWRTTYVWNRDSSPVSGVQKDDRNLTTGLLIQW